MTRASGEIHRWTETEFEFLRAYAPGHSYQEITDAFDDVFGVRLRRPQLVNALRKCGAKCGINTGCIKPGTEPFNKGRPITEWMAPDKIAKSAAGRFKKGNMPHNAVPVGAERVAKGGYIEVHIAEKPFGVTAHDNWVPKHRLVWEQHNGPLPKGHIVLFADRDKRNFDPNNLVAVSRRVSATINHLGIDYSDRETLLTAIEIAKTHGAVNDALKRPRPCKQCGKTFKPRYGHQRTCDVCLGRE